MRRRASLLGTTENYASYQWSNASTDPTITVGTGSYSVTVTNAEGCSTTSAPFTVTVGSNVNAAYRRTFHHHNRSVLDHFSDNSSVDGSTIVNWQWIFDPVNGGSTQPNTTNLYETPGTYPVTLIVTAADGCTDTINGSSGSFRRISRSRTCSPRTAMNGTKTWYSRTYSITRTTLRSSIVGGTRSTRKRTTRTTGKHPMFRMAPISMCFPFLKPTRNTPAT
ncbi:MAG: PKD domain-containing protein [Flavobacteriales bacterium]|nr:PKD domain-containing protein [Flavobacteriales bacterium]